jgi:Trypsin-like peptidase domain
VIDFLRGPIRYKTDICYNRLKRVNLQSAYIGESIVLVPPIFINSVAALGNMLPLPDKPEEKKWFTFGTAFFFGVPVEPGSKPTKAYYTFLVTAKHVVEKRIESKSGIRIRVNSTDPTATGRDFELPMAIGGPGNWFFHPNSAIDIAAIQINWEFLKRNKVEPNFFSSDFHTADRATLKLREVAAGDGIYLLGFPMNMAGEQRNYVILRQGCIARISEMLDDASTSFLVDAPVYPGNSGGPVILKPELFAIQETKPQETSTLLGIVTNAVNYLDYAISEQTRTVRVVFTENAGLAIVLPVDYITETISAFQAANPQAEGAKPEVVPQAEAT